MEQEIKHEEQVQQEQPSNEQPAQQAQPNNDLLLGEIKKYVDIKISELMTKFESADKVETQSKQEENIEW